MRAEARLLGRVFWEDMGREGTGAVLKIGNDRWLGCSGTAGVLAAAVARSRDAARGLIGY